MRVLGFTLNQLFILRELLVKIHSFDIYLPAIGYKYLIWKVLFIVRNFQEPKVSW